MSTPVVRYVKLSFMFIIIDETKELIMKDFDLLFK